MAKPEDMEALPVWNWLTVNKIGIGYLNVKPEDAPKFCRLFKAFRLEMNGKKYTFEAVPFEGHEKPYRLNVWLPAWEAPREKKANYESANRLLEMLMVGNGKIGRAHV